MTHPNDIQLLSIDDSKAVHAFLNRCFAETRFKLTHAMGGNEGIQKLKAAPGFFSIILLDWEMPEMSGPETLEILKSEAIETPVVMLTSKNEVKDIELMLAKGVKEYVMKPFTPDMIIEKLNSILDAICL